MDLEPAEHATSATSRRSLIRALGAAGVVGAAAAWVSGSGSASTNIPTAADTELLAEAMALELTARDLYRVALDRGVDEETTVLVTAIAQNHSTYAQNIAGTTGLSANQRNEEVFQALEAEFESGDVVLAAHTLEQTAVATHTALLGRYEGLQAINLTASIIVVEARHATVLADIAGVSDLDVVFGNEQEPAAAVEALG